MKTVVITECDTETPSGDFIFDLNKMPVHDCIGCWTCWWKTPGRCIYKDLDNFYHQYITADKVIYKTKVTRAFVSGKLKTLFDRMIPLYLPYTDFSSGESMHVPRYDHYPEIEFYYDGEFNSAEEKVIFENYIRRAFYQFYCKLNFIKPLDTLNVEEGDIR